MKPHQRQKARATADAKWRRFDPRQQARESRAAMEAAFALQPAPAAQTPLPGADWIVSMRAMQAGATPKQLIAAATSRAELAHEIWAAAQLGPEEGIEDGVARIQALLAPAAQEPLTKAGTLKVTVSGSVSTVDVDWLDPMPHKLPVGEYLIFIGITGAAK